MTEFTHIVEKQRLMESAEKWANTVKLLHHHRLTSMWYDTRPEDTKLGYVTDIEYNSGLIERTLKNGKKVYFGERLTGEDLLFAYTHQ